LINYFKSYSSLGDNRFLRHPVLSKAQFFQGKSETKMIYIRQLRSFLMNGVCFSTHTRDTYWRKWVLSFDFQLGRL